MSSTLTAAHNVRCQAFVTCENAAIGQVPHPILGAYLSCRRCADRLGVEIQPAEVTITEEVTA